MRAISGSASIQPRPVDTSARWTRSDRLRHVPPLVLVAERMSRAFHVTDIVVAADDDVQLAQGRGVEEELDVAGVEPIEAARDDHPPRVRRWRRKGIVREARKGYRPGWTDTRCRSLAHASVKPGSSSAGSTTTRSSAAHPRPGGGRAAGLDHPDAAPRTAAAGQETIARAEGRPAAGRSGNATSRSDARRTWTLPRRCASCNRRTSINREIVEAGRHHDERSPTGVRRGRRPGGHGRVQAHDSSRRSRSVRTVTRKDPGIALGRRPPGTRPHSRSAWRPDTTPGRTRAGPSGRSRWSDARGCRAATPPTRSRRHSSRRPGPGGPAP